MKGKLMETKGAKDDVLRTVEESLTNQSPYPEQIRRIENVRGAAKSLAAEIIDNSEPSRQRSLAITKLEESVMWAVKGIVLEDGGD